MQGRTKSGRPKRRWLDIVRGDIREKGLSPQRLCDQVTWRRTSTPHKRGTKMKIKKKRNINKNSKYILHQTDTRHVVTYQQSFYEIRSRPQLEQRLTESDGAQTTPSFVDTDTGTPVKHMHALVLLPTSVYSSPYMRPSVKVM